MDELGFHYTYTPVYSPQYNGIEEVFNIAKKEVKKTSTLSEEQGFLRLFYRLLKKGQTIRRAFESGFLSSWRPSRSSER